MNNLTLNEFIIITEDEAIDNYGIDEHIINLSGGNVAVFNGNLTLNTDLIIEKAIKYEDEVSGIIILGDLNVNKAIINKSSNNTFLIVLGNVNAENISLIYSEVYFKGDVIVSNVIFGKYEEGSIIFDGNVTAKTIISYQHEIVFRGEVNSIIIQYGGGIAGVEPDYDSETIKDILTDELFDEEGYLDASVINDYILQNENIIKKQ